jgi:hypothetical protein
VVRGATLLSCWLFSGCAVDSESTAESSSMEATLSSTSASPVAYPSAPVPAPENPLSRDLARAASLDDAVAALQGHFGDESDQTAFAMRTVQSPAGAGLLEDWMNRNAVTDAELWRAERATTPAGLTPRRSGSRVCVHVARHTRADPAEPFSLLASAVGQPEPSAEPGSRQAFYLRVVGALPPRLPAHFCGVYTGQLIGDDGSAPKIVGRFVGPRPGLTPHHP